MTLHRIAWVTDIHLNFLSDERICEFARQIAAHGPDSLLVTGDISEAPSLREHLELLADTLGPRPIYFVLGNHDFYRGSLEAVRRTAEAITKEHDRLRWLPTAGPIPLSDRTVLLGCDGWGDARCGDYWNSDVYLNDFRLIEELRGLTTDLLAERLNAEGDRWGDWVRTHLPPALDRFDRVLFATHVPPFEGACWHEGRISDSNWLPHFTCKAVGDALLDCAAAQPGKKITVLCGHTHGSGEMASGNLEVWTGGAHYGAPHLQRVLEV
jgi:3',5'-cyclic-AMP phosphodiesterase